MFFFSSFKEKRTCFRPKAYFKKMQILDMHFVKHTFNFYLCRVDGHVRTGKSEHKTRGPERVNSASGVAVVRSDIAGARFGGTTRARLFQNVGKGKAPGNRFFGAPKGNFENREQSAGAAESQHFARRFPSGRFPSDSSISASSLRASFRISLRISRRLPTISILDLFRSIRENPPRTRFLFGTQRRAPFSDRFVSFSGEASAVPGASPRREILPRLSRSRRLRIVSDVFGVFFEIVAPSGDAGGFIFAGKRGKHGKRGKRRHGRRKTTKGLRSQIPMSGLQQVLLDLLRTVQASAISLLRKRSVSSEKVV